MLKSAWAAASELADDLGRFLEGLPVRARPVGSLERAWRWCKSNKVVASLVALLALSLLAGTITAWVLYLRAEDRATQARQQKEKAQAEEKLRREALVSAAQAVDRASSWSADQR